MTTEEIMQQIRDEVRVCEKCPLHMQRKNAVPGEGPARVDVMLIGEGPGHHENEQGKPFVGQAGMFLDELLAAANLDRKNVFITNVVKCRPPGNRDPEPTELSTCRGYLDRQINALNPKIIITLGRFSMARFVANGKISQIHGQAHLVEGRTVITMYHPTAALHQPDLRGSLLRDFANLKTRLAPKPEIPPSSPATPAQKRPAEKEDDNEYKQLSLF